MTLKTGAMMLKIQLLYHNFFFFFTFTFTFMHLADAFIQSDLHCIQVTVSTFFLSALAFPGNRTHDLGVASAMLLYVFKHIKIIMYYNISQYTMLYFWSNKCSLGEHKGLLKTYKILLTLNVWTAVLHKAQCFKNHEADKISSHSAAG